MARPLTVLEKENGRLKRLVADQALEIPILKEASRHTCEPEQVSDRRACMALDRP